VVRVYEITHKIIIYYPLGGHLGTFLFG